MSPDEILAALVLGYIAVVVAIPILLVMINP